MEKLIKKFEDISIEELFADDEIGGEEELAEMSAQLTKKIAIDFAKHYLSGTIKKHLAGSEKVEEYRTSEMDLLLGELLKDGDKKFYKFLETYEL